VKISGIWNWGLGNWDCCQFQVPNSKAGPNYRVSKKRFLFTFLLIINVLDLNSFPFGWPDFVCGREIMGRDFISQSEGFW
jgi:hypothetical protein